MNLIGTRFGAGHQILREVARGTEAYVYLASDGSEVRAVKLFPIGREERAEREFRFGRSLAHPNLNPVDARLELAGRPGVLMPFVPGHRFGRWLPAASRPARLAALDGLLAGLAHLHARGIVHRDVKPENLLITRDGRAVLIDYDLAMDVRDEVDRRTMAGTVAYLSPEQARGEPAGPASDLYAAGVMLYRALTGEVPFSGSVGEVLTLHRTAAPRAPSRFDPSLRAFDALVTRLLDKDPELRPPDAATVRAALAELVAGA